MGKIAAPTVLRNQDEEGFRKALNDLLNEIEGNGIEISEREMDERVTELCGEFGVTIPKTKRGKTTCPTCGAPIHGKQCDYCGNIINYL